MVCVSYIFALPGAFVGSVKNLLALKVIFGEYPESVTKLSNRREFSVSFPRAEVLPESVSRIHLKNHLVLLRSRSSGDVV